MNSIVIVTPAAWRPPDNLPVGWVASVMGLTVLSIVRRPAQAHFGAAAQR